MPQIAQNSKSLSEIRKLLGNAFLVEWKRNDGKFVADVMFHSHREAGRFEGMLSQMLPDYQPLPISSLRYYMPFTNRDKAVTLECDEGTPLHGELRNLLVCVPEENRRILDSVTTLVPGISIGMGGKSSELQIADDRLMRVIDEETYAGLSEDEQLQFERNSDGTYQTPITTPLAREYAKSYTSVEQAVARWNTPSRKTR
jgi:hypothetical protein